MTRVELAVLLGLLVSCRQPIPREDPRFLQEHVDDARQATGGATPAEADSLTEFEAKLVEIRDRWEKRLANPETLLEFYDFTSPEMTKLREEASRDTFVASLGQSLTLERVMAGAFVRNADLRRAAKHLQATIEEYSQVTYLDTIMRQYVSFMRTLDIRVGPVVPMDQVQKRFPFPGTLELKAAVVGHGVEVAHAQYEAALIDMVTSVRVAYADYVYLAHAIRITNETLGYVRQLEATVRGKLAAGTAQKAHVLQSQVEISSLENEIVTLEQERETVRARLNTLLDLPPATPLAEPAAATLPPTPPSPDALYARALEEQPEIRIAKARADRMATMIELAEQATYPELSPGLWTFEDVSHATEGTGKEREPFGTRPKVMPDPWFGSREAYLREAREMERASRAEVTAAKDRTLFRVKAAWVRLDTARRLQALYRDVQINQAEQAYSDAAAGYAADRVEFLNVIDALRRWLHFLLAEDQAGRDYAQAHARLEGAVGGPVPRKEK